ncbi:MAG: Fur family transcriptional regulator [Pseudomonadota bacterium]
MGERGQKTQAAVLSVLRRHRRALSAYELLGKMRDTHPRISAPTIYRALAALTELGQVHRLESLNAFIACKNRRHDCTAVLSICDDCGSIEESEAPDLVAELSKVTARSGFAALRHVIEIHGRCASCGDGEARA